MSSNIYNQVREMFKRMDSEALLSLALQAELVREEDIIDIPLTLTSMDEIIHDTCKAIIKDRFDNKADAVVRTHRNQMGFSVSIKTDAIAEALEFSNRSFNADYRDRSFNADDFNAFVNQFRRPHLNFFVFNSTLQMKNNRLVFYFRYSDYQHYNNDSFMVFHALFEMIHLIESWEVAVEEEIPRRLEEYEQHRSRLDDIVREERERQERERREREERERRVREEQERREREERERREAEEAERRREYEDRQRLIRAGATEEGIDIASRLLEMLGRR